MNPSKNLVRELIANHEGKTFGYKEENTIWPAWHYHPEIDILLFLRGSGQHITGDFIGSFSPGTLILNGSNIPHGFTTIEAPTTNDQPAIISIQFSIQSIGPEFLSKTEMKSISNFIQSNRKSYEYLGETKTEATRIIHEIGQSKDPQRFILFLSLLATLAEAPPSQKESLVSDYYKPVLTEKNINRIEHLRQWLLENIAAEISLRDAAALLSMSAKSFSYFFKKNTGKSFSNYLKELRIGLACQKLVASNDSILDICYASGFNNLSNFNRQFRELKNATPSEFRKQSQRLTAPSIVNTTSM